MPLSPDARQLSPLFEEKYTTTFIAECMVSIHAQPSAAQFFVVDVVLIAAAVNEHLESAF